ncbi:MAG TPA: PIG-L family deacetylase, partial [Candidatus Acidoferrales bacterium]
MNGCRNRWVAITVAAISAATTWLSGAVPASAQTLPEVVQAIEKARVPTRILYVTAHPDDETAGLLAYLSRGLCADVAILTITRGQGGQNAIGPEQDGPLGVIRTTELLAADEHYGVHQYFTRAVDPGFSKSPERTMKIWGDAIPLEDMVRVILMYRPEVVINGWGGVHFGHGQHQASGLLTPVAIADAADPTKFPEQIGGAVRAWRVKLELRPASFGFGPAPSKPTPGAV